MQTSSPVRRGLRSGVAYVLFGLGAGLGAGMCWAQRSYDAGLAAGREQVHRSLDDILKRSIDGQEGASLEDACVADRLFSSALAISAALRGDEEYGRSLLEYDAPRCRDLTGR